jgi:peptidoglycan/LPS O-acetylase OafA/YrhL
MNIKEKIKNFWNDFKKNWLWVNIGAYISTTITSWLLFCIEIVDLVFAIFFTVFYPLLMFFAYYARKSKHQKLITKIVLVGCGGFSFGLFLWLILGYVLFNAPWAPFQDLPPVLIRSIFLLLLISCCVIGGSIMYIVGKKREWRLPSTY